MSRSTLGDKVTGRILPGSRSGKKRYLSDTEEDELVQFMLNCAFVGHPRSRMEVMALVQLVCDQQKIDAVVSHGW